MVSEQDGRVFNLASKSLNFCLFSSWFFHFFRRFRNIMAVYVTRVLYMQLIVCTAVVLSCFFVYLFVYLFIYYSLYISSLCVFVCICLFITTLMSSYFSAWPAHSA